MQVVGRLGLLSSSIHRMDAEDARTPPSGTSICKQRGAEEWLALPKWLRDLGCFVLTDHGVGVLDTMT